MAGIKDYTWVRIRYELKRECNVLYRPNLLVRFLSYAAAAIIWFISKLFSRILFSKTINPINREIWFFEKDAAEVELDIAIEKKDNRLETRIKMPH